MASTLQSINIHEKEALRVFDVEIEAIREVQEQAIGKIDPVVDYILACSGKVVVTGLGKSGIIAHKIAATFASTGTPAVFLNASEALHGDLGVVGDRDVVIMVSNSGATRELSLMLPSLRRYHATVIGLFGQDKTELARQCDCVLNASVSREACPISLAPTASSTASLVLGDALACAVMVARKFTPEQYAINHPSGALGRRLLLKASDVMHRGEALPLSRPDATIREIAITMTKTSLGAICVADENDRLLGIITDGDLRRHLAQSSDLTRPAQQLMHHNPTVASPDDSLQTLMSLMESPAKKIYTLPIVEGEHQVVGLVRMHDLLSDK